MNKNSNNVAAAVIAFLGIITVLVVFKEDLDIAKNSSQPIFLIIDLVYIAACGVSGYALLNSRNDLLNIGSFIAAGGAALKVIKIFKWVSSNYSYNGGTYDGMGWHLLYLFGEIAGTAAFIMFGMLLTKKYEEKLKDKENVIIGLLATSGIIQLVYPFRFFNTYTYNRADFFKDYLTGYSSITSFVFLIGAFIFILYTMMQLKGVQMQVAQNSEAVVSVPIQNPSGVTVGQEGQAFNNRQLQTAESAYEANEQNNLELLRKYKELLDAEIITQEEFNERKQQLLNL